MTPSGQHQFPSEHEYWYPQRHRDGGGDISVTNQSDSGTGFADFLNEFVVTLALHDDYYQFFNRAIQALGKNFQVFSSRLVDIYMTLCLGGAASFFM
jgi:hypothetical protein